MKIPCAIYRGGTSKPIFFLEKDLPSDNHLRDRTILSAFGSPDSRQIDGLGGSDPLTSKVAYIAPATDSDSDINYTFGYVGITAPVIDYTGNCGNTSAAVGPFALLRGLIEPREPFTKVRIFNTNTKKIIVAEFAVKDGAFHSEGDFKIDGVPGTGSKVLLDFLDSGGSVTGKLLPTGKPQEKINTPTRGPLTVSLVDAANPFIFVKARDLGLKENATAEEIAEDTALLNQCEEIRSIAAEMMGITNAREATRLSPGVPKIALVSPPTSYKTSEGEVKSREVDIVARMTALQKLHKTYAVTGAVCLGAAAMIEGTVVNELFQGWPSQSSTSVRIGHPSGTLQVEIDLARENGRLTLSKAALARTARLLMDGIVHVPKKIVTG